MEMICKRTSLSAGFRSQSPGPQASAHLAEKSVHAPRGNVQTEAMREAGLRGLHLMPSPARNDAEVGAAVAKHLHDESASEG